MSKNTCKTTVKKKKKHKKVEHYDTGCFTQVNNPVCLEQQKTASQQADLLFIIRTTVPLKMDPLKANGQKLLQLYRQPVNCIKMFKSFILFKQLTSQSDLQLRNRSKSKLSHGQL